MNTFRFKLIRKIWKYSLQIVRMCERLYTDSDHHVVTRVTESLFRSSEASDGPTFRGNWYTRTCWRMRKRGTVEEGNIFFLLTEIENTVDILVYSIYSFYGSWLTRIYLCPSLKTRVNLSLLGQEVESQGGLTVGPTDTGSLYPIVVGRDKVINNFDYYY